MTQPLTLVIGNKNYSSWSLRPWALMTQLGIPFTERMLKFDSQDWDENIAALSPTRLVPVLWEGEPGQGFATFDTSAIVERLADLYPDRGIWPADDRARARARSLVATFHSGYSALRSAMPMNIRSSYPGKGQEPEVTADIERLTALWRAARAEFGGGRAVPLRPLLGRRRLLPAGRLAVRDVRAAAGPRSRGLLPGAARHEGDARVERGGTAGDGVCARGRALR